jgi:RNA recognition motif-containing protein
MPRKLYVTNLGPAVARDEVERLFAAHGTIRSVAVLHPFVTADRPSTGTAFVEMDSEIEGEAAIAALNGVPHSGGAALAVRWAVPGSRQGLDLSRMFEPVIAPGPHDASPTVPNLSHDGFRDQCWRSGGRGPH